MASDNSWNRMRQGKKVVASNEQIVEPAAARQLVRIVWRWWIVDCRQWYFCSWDYHSQALRIHGQDIWRKTRICQVTVIPNDCQSDRLGEEWSIYADSSKVIFLSWHPKPTILIFNSRRMVPGKHLIWNHEFWGESSMYYLEYRLFSQSNNKNEELLNYPWSGYPQNGRVERKLGLIQWYKIESRKGGRKLL